MLCFKIYTNEGICDIVWRPYWIQDGRHLNYDYNNDYLIIRHVLSHEYFCFRVYKCRIVY